MALNVGFGFLVGLNLMMSLLNGWKGNMWGFGLGMGCALICLYALGYRIHTQREYRKFQRLFDERKNGV